MASEDQPNTREKIKDAGQRLIAEHGVDGVSVRDIVTRAGQKNMASLYYYFGTKEELLKELIVDTSILMEGRRAEALSRLEESGKEISVKQIVDILVGGAMLDAEIGGRNLTVMRFLGAVVASHRHLFEEAISNEYNKTYQRCLDLIRQRLPHIPEEILNQRLLFLSHCSSSLLVARESGIASGGRAREYWSTPRTDLNMLDFLTAALEAPVSFEIPPDLKNGTPQRRQMVGHFPVPAS